MSEDRVPDPAKAGRIRLVVDQNLCIGIGQCELLEPEVFRLDDDSGVARILSEATLDRSRAELVIDRCPSGAIAAITAEPGTAD